MVLISKYDLLTEVGKILQIKGIYDKMNRTKAQYYGKSLKIVSGLPLKIRKAMDASAEEIKKWQKGASALDQQMDQEVPMNLNGNGSVWECLGDSMTFLHDSSITGQSASEVNDVFNLATEIMAMRSPPGSRTLPTGRNDEASEDVVRLHNDLIAMYLSLSDMRARANRKFEEEKLQMLQGIFAAKMKTKTLEPWPTNGFCTLYQAYRLFIIETNGRIYFLLDAHLTRLIDLFKVLSNWLLALSVLDLRDTPEEALSTLVHLGATVAKENPEYVGEAFKAARNRLIARLADDNITGRSAESLLTSLYDPIKNRLSSYIVSEMSRMSRCQTDNINLCNFFKVVPHPDANLKKAVDNIRGLTEPNTVEQAAIPRYTGTLYKSIYLSLVDCGYNPRLQEGVGNRKIVQLANAMDRNLPEIRKSNVLEWAGVAFTRVFNVPTLDKITVKPADKSSAPKVDTDEMSFEEAKRFHAHSLCDNDILSNPVETLRPINDAYEALTSDIKDTFSSAWRRFRRIKDSFTAYEITLGLDFNSADNITPGQIKTWVENNEKLAYTVMTEPKLGEVHKETTRLFYMGEQEQKILTQKIERLAKIISRRQTGVSIVKSFVSRRRDMEDFAKSMISSDPDTKTLFISFDMSEFSKRFPMILVRIYGRIMAQITGDPELERIDLLFKASRVVHNNRGFFDTIEGIKGGFEGFFNFIWSSLHAAIMDEALQVSGLKGILLTFSDDGLLRLLVSRDILDQPAAILLLITLIRQEYASHGLEFHLGKTLISTKVWEYLGDVCYDAHLIPMWLKELSTIGIVENDTGFNSFYSFITRVESQCMALCKSQAPPNLAGFLLVRESLMAINRKFPNLTTKMKIALLVLPTSVGGFRCKTHIELMMNSTIEPLAEFVADLVLLSKIYPDLVSSIVYGITINMGTKSEHFRSLLLGHRFSANFPDTSGLGVANEMVDQISQVATGLGKVEPNPITPSIINKLNIILKTIRDINPVIIQKIIQSTPQWERYTSSLMLVKTSTAIKLLSRKQVRKYQAKDSKMCHEAVNKWKDLLSQSSDDSAQSLVVRISRVLSTDFSIIPLKRSPREFVEITNMTSETRGQFCFATNGKITLGALSYIEPEASFISAMESSSLGPADSISSSPLRKMLKVLIQVFATRSDIYPQIEAMLSLFKLAMPAVANLNVHGANRVRAFKGAKSDINILIPSVFINRISIQQGRELMPFYLHGVSKDRTSLEGYLTVLTASELTSRGIYRKVADGTLMTVNFRINDLYFPTYDNRPMRAHMALPAMALPNVEPLDPVVVADFRATLEETARYQASIDELDEPIQGNHDYIRGVYSDALQLTSCELANTFRHIYLTQTYPGASCQQSIKSDLLYNTDIMQQAIYRLSFRLLTKSQQKVLSDHFHINYDREDIPNDIVDSIMSLREPLDKLVSNVTKFHNNMLVPSQILNLNRTHIRLIKEEALASTFNPIVPAHIILSARGVNAHATVTSSRVDAVRRIMNSLVKRFYNAAEESRYDFNRVADRLGVPRSPYFEIYGLSILAARELLRPSAHRNPETPYNKKSYLIEMAKIHECVPFVRSYFNDRPREEVDYANVRTQVMAFRMSNRHRETLIRGLHIGAHIGAEAVDHADHRLKLTTGILQAVVKRVSMIIVYQANGFPWTREEFNEHMNRPTYIQDLRMAETTFYNVFLATINRNIREYSIGEAEALRLNAMTAKKPDKFISMVPYIGEVPRLDIVVDEQYNELRDQLRYIHLIILAKKKCISLLNPGEGVRPNIVNLMTLNGFFSRKGTRVINYMNNEEGTGEVFHLISFRSRRLDNLVYTLSRIALQFEISAAITYDHMSDQYVLDGAYFGERIFLNILEGSGEHAYYEDSVGELMLIIDPENHIQGLFKGLNHQISDDFFMDYSPVLLPYNPDISAPGYRMIDRVAPASLPDYPIMSMATIFVSTDNTSKLMSYLLFQLSRNRAQLNNQMINRAVTLMGVFRRRFRTLSRIEQIAIQDEIRGVTSWLTLRPINSSKVYDGDIARLLTHMSRMGRLDDLNLSGILIKGFPRTVSEDLMHELDDGNVYTNDEFLDRIFAGHSFLSPLLFDVIEVMAADVIENRIDGDIDIDNMEMLPE